MKYVLLLLFTTFAFGLDAQDSKKEFKINPKLKDLGDNTLLSLGTFSFEKPEGEPNAGSVTDYSGMTYDMHNHRILLFGGGHSATWTDAIYSFDFNDLTFKPLYKPTPFSEYKQDNVDKAFFQKGPEGKYPRPIGRHTYDLLVVPDDRNELWMLRTGTGPTSAAPGFGYIGGAIGKFDFKTEQWEQIDGAGVGFGGYGGVAEYDPESKLIIGIASQTVYAYNPETRVCTKILNNIIDKNKDTFGYSGCLVYYPPNKKMYIFGPKAKNIWALELNREDLKQSQLIKIEDAGEFPKNENSYVYDSKNKIIGGGVADNKFYAFDPSKGKWESKIVEGGEPGKMTFHCISYSPIDNVYIFIGDQKKLWAYRWKN